MKTQKIQLSNHTLLLNVELIKKNVRKKLKKSLADTLINLLDILSNDCKTANIKKTEQLVQVINQIHVATK